ncbi:L,D-transpeptidase family protein [Candidatus Pelagibacter sp.]|nr:L,D-transpeptidase family protein [Candidatus Pelagibacter sp.]
MTIIIKNKETLIYKEFKFRCSIGRYGFTKKKTEGDKKTPCGLFKIGNLYYRSDRNDKPVTKLKCIPIKKSMGWCDDPKNKKNYNRLIKIKKGIGHEKMYRKNQIYDLLIPVKYNTKKPIAGKGSAIFIHLTNNYKKTLGCIAINKNDFLILLKLINKKTKIKIN